MATLRTAALLAVSASHGTRLRPGLLALALASLSNVQHAHADGVYKPSMSSPSPPLARSMFNHAGPRSAVARSVPDVDSASGPSSGLSMPPPPVIPSSRLAAALSRVGHARVALAEAAALVDSRRSASRGTAVATVGDDEDDADEDSAFRKSERCEHLERAMLEVRCLCEEAAEALELAWSGSSLHQHPSAAVEARTSANILRKAAHAVEVYQKHQRDRVNAVLDSILPPGSLRARLVAAARAKSEARNLSSLEELVHNGGSIRDKYRLLWQQQWARRESLASLASMGSSTAVSRLLVQYMAGVPAPVLAFARNINSDHGPSADLRILYGTAIMDLIHALEPLHTLAVELLSCSNRQSGEGTTANSHVSHAVVFEASRALRSAAEAFHGETRGLIEILEVAVTNSSFSVHAETLAPATAP